MEFKGTKGKWVVDIDESSYNEFHQLCTPISRKYPGHGTIVRLCEVYGEDEPSIANALLISKAPEMLEMLINLTEVCDIKILKDKAEQLIKEATEL